MKILTLGAVPLCVLLALFCVSAAQHAEDEDDDGVVVETESEVEDYVSPKIDSKRVHFADSFDDNETFNKKWVRSATKKRGVDEDIAKYDGTWELQELRKTIFKTDRGLVLTSKAKHAAISSMLNKPFKFTDKPFIVQYEVALQEGQECGGAYLKLLSDSIKTKSDLKEFHDKSPYTIMFGPDKCGNDHKLHFIFRHRNPKTGVYEEKHCNKKFNQRLDEIYKDKDPHLYTLIVWPDNTYTIKVDEREMASGSLLEDFNPAVNPPAEIDDPNDKKPEDWDEREKIPDPTATKPDDWDENAPPEIPDESAQKPDGWLDDEPNMIPDPEAVKPSDWDEEMDGSWEAPLIDNPRCADAPGCGPWTRPMIPNPNYKGIWRAPLITNPSYKGKWSPRRIPNPDFFHDDHPFKMTPISAVGFELWSMSPQLLFDNLLITDDPLALDDWTQQTFRLKSKKIAKDSDSAWSWLVRVTEENSWLWAVYVFVAVASLGLFVYFCCIKDTGAPDEETVKLDPKKTDEVQEDDPQEDQSAPEETSADQEEEGSESQESGDERPAGKEQLEAPQVPNDGSGEGGQQRKRKPRKE